MARMLLSETCDLAKAILAGEHDADLDYIQQACRARVKSMWRAGMRVTLEGTRNPKFEGQTGIVLKVNQKTVVVGLGEYDQFGYETELNVPPSMLRTVSNG